MKKPVYLDYQATTPVDSRVLKEILPYFEERFGNASSVHEYGFVGKAAVDRARKQVAELLDVQPEEIYFTSGATESNSIAIKGLVEKLEPKGKHIITSPVEHKAVLAPLMDLRERGWEVTVLEVNSHGQVDLEQLEKSIRDDTVLVSLIHGNNEIGTIQDLEAIGEVCGKKGVVLHSDCVQTAGKIAVSAKQLKLGMASISAHKIYGPKGVGALFLSRKNPRVRVVPQTLGGGHEGGVRSGTLNIPGIVGLGKACEIAKQEMSQENEKLKTLRDQLYESIQSKIEHCYLNGHPERRLPNNLNLSFVGVSNNLLVSELKNDLAIASGSACSSANPEPSHVLQALNIGDERSQSSVRISLGRMTTPAEVEYAADRMVEAVNKLRKA